MLVLSFAVSGRGNCAIVAGAPFMYARTEAGSFILPARCPHRGGPLNLSTPVHGSARIVCPWHERATSVTRALKAGIPAVRRGNVVTAVFPTAVDTTHHLEHRPMSRELALESRTQPYRRAADGAASATTMNGAAP